MYFLKENFEVFSAFKKFKTLVGKKSGHNTKAMRSTIGGKFTSKEFKEYCKNHVIHRPLIVSYSP